VGLMPLLAVETLDHDLIESLPVFKRRLNWFFENRVYLRDSGNIAYVKDPGEQSRRLLSIVNRERLMKVLGPMLDENEFLSPYGIRSVFKFHQEHPIRLPRRWPSPHHRLPAGRITKRTLRRQLQLVRTDLFSHQHFV
jgi:hypothetical protein